MSTTVKTVLVVGAIVVALYLFSGGGSVFQLAPGNRLAPNRQAPSSAGPGTRYGADANAWSVGAAAVNALGQVGTSYFASPKYSTDLGATAAWNNVSTSQLDALAAADAAAGVEGPY